MASSESMVSVSVAVEAVVVQRGLNPTKTLVGFGSLKRGKLLAAEKLDDKGERCEEREMVRRVLAAPPMAASMELCR